MSKKQIVLFTMEGCPWCSDMKKMLQEENIEFLDRNINQYEDE